MTQATALTCLPNARPHRRNCLFDLYPEIKKMDSVIPFPLHPAAHITR